MLCGCPVVSTKTGGISDIVIDGETGISVNEKEADKLNESFNLIVNDFELTHKLIENAHKHVSSQFTWNIIGEKYYQVYKEIL